ncbi:MAG: signal recognition particle-docking protein FtsY [Proteobacteria bacterium]|nr:signal recognition particle-docking protein FtsY [Pseudomonadota bacterium]
MPGDGDEAPALGEGREDAAEAGEIPSEGGAEALGAPSDAEAPAAEAAAPTEGAEAPPLGTAVEEAPSDALPAAHTEVPAEPGPALSLPMGIGIGVVALLVIGFGARAVLGSSPPALPDTTASPSEPEAPAVEAAPEPERLVDRFRGALGRSREALQGRFDTLFGRGTIDEELFSDLEETLLKADVGLPTTERLLDPLRAQAKDGEDDPTVLRESLRDGIRDLLLLQDPSLLSPPDEGPWVILVVGVNGSGKTTTIGKLASRFKAEGRSVLLAAGDTYRAGAAAQLKVWAERAEVDIVAHDEGSDPGAVVYDALEAARARGRDLVIVDTAGRLQTQKPLMEQLGKIRRVIDKKVPGAPHETLLVLDGTMGQNGLSQAKLFDAATPLTGAVITKLDGTAKGGMVLTLSAELELPVKFVGIGEGIDDLKPFDPVAFAEALA